MPGSVILREQLRFLRERGDGESLLQVLPRSAAQGATGFISEAGSQPVARASGSGGDFRAGGGFFFVGGVGCCATTRRGGGEAERAEPVRDVQEARGAHGVQVPVRDDAVWGPPLPGAA